MSGGFFRGTSADQDTRFSNKNAKLLKTQKFAPELDQLVDIGKINMNVMRPWIANRVTELMGFEDEVLINFIYGLLEAKNVDGKQIQINLTGFMEKNTGKFMRELWGLLTSAQNSMNGIPQQFLDQKAEEVGKKKAEEQRVLAEVQRKEEEKKGADQDLMKKENLPKAGEISILIGTKLSSFKGEKSPDGDGLEARNGTTESRPPRSRSRSASLSNKNVSRYPRKRNVSQSISRSPPRRSRRSMTPRRRMSPSYRRSRSPVRRARSPIRTRSPRRHRRSSAYSRSPRGRSPIAVARSPRRRRSPSYSPRGRSSILHSPRRRHSPVHSRSSPRRRKSPHRTPPRYRRRSPVHSRSPPRRYPLASPPARRRHTAASPKRRMDPSPSPRRRPVPQSARRASRSPLHSLSPEASSKSPRVSPHRHISTSPLRSFSPSPRGRSTRASLSLPSYRHSPSPSKVEKTLGNRSRGMLHSAAPEIHKSPSPSLSPERWQRSRGSLDVSPVNMKSHLKSPLLNRGLARDRSVSPVKSERSRRIAPNVPTSKKRTRSLSRENPLQNEDRQAAPVKKPTNFDAISDAPPAMNHQARKHEEPDCSISKSSDGDQQMSPGVDQRNRKGIDSDENEENHSNPSPIHLDDRKEAKRRRKEERRLRKEEKRRRREERHRRKEEKRASKASSKDIASVTPPPDLEKRMMCTDDNNTSQEGKHEEDEDMEIEQRRLENELRKKALESIKAKKVGSS